eukprot:scaffold9802_cov100-Isochrysis_galbana.AAC.3
MGAEHELGQPRRKGRPAGATEAHPELAGQPTDRAAVGQPSAHGAARRAERPRAVDVEVAERLGGVRASDVRRQGGRDLLELGREPTGGGGVPVRVLPLGRRLVYQKRRTDAPPAGAGVAGAAGAKAAKEGVAAAGGAVEIWSESTGALAALDFPSPASGAHGEGEPGIGVDSGIGTSTRPPIGVTAANAASTAAAPANEAPSPTPAMSAVPSVGPPAACIAASTTACTVADTTDATTAAASVSAASASAASTLAPTWVAWLCAVPAGGMRSVPALATAPPLPSESVATAFDARDEEVAE